MNENTEVYGNAAYVYKKVNSLANLQGQSNLITFNQRYAQMSYDGYHFSQLGAIFNLAVNVQF